MLFIEIPTELNSFRQDVSDLTFVCLNTVQIKKQNICNKGHK